MTSGVCVTTTCYALLVKLLWLCSYYAN